MIFKLIFLTVILAYGVIISWEKETNELHANEFIYDYLHVYDRNDTYRGEKFPTKYLTTDGISPTRTDLITYLKNLKKTANYFAVSLNDTDPNVSLGFFFMKAVLKRTLLDYGDKIKDLEKRAIKRIIGNADNYLSHFAYENSPYGSSDFLFKLSNLLRFDEAIVHALGDLNMHRLKKWINSDVRLHDDIEKMDDVTLPRIEYVEQVISMDAQYKMYDSDFCITSINNHPLPIRYDVMTRCRRQEYCAPRVFKVPSVAYALSHRYIYVVGLNLVRRCYVTSEEGDRTHLDIMCANMYRETVYLARLGYFFRDLFLEHIALCALLGYEEFFRHNWFKKAVSWIDEEGCIMENRNFELNRTSIYIAQAKSLRMKRKYKKMKRTTMDEVCQHHQMALLMIVLAHAIRYTAHYM